MKTALILGVTGQDGAYLAQMLSGMGTRVVGSTRALASADVSRLEALDVRHRVELIAVQPEQASIAATLAVVQPDEIYALWGQSSVGASFDHPAATFDSIAVATLAVLEAMREVVPAARLFHAGSAESFGDLSVPATEVTPLRPVSPYGVAKASAQMLVATYREVYGLFAVNGILFNHESPQRPARFVTRKIASAARRIAEGSGERVSLGRTDIVRDWGWAPDYVDAMRRSLQVDQPDDYIIATGRSHALSDFVAAAFATFDLDWRDHVDFDPALVRPSDPPWSGADPSRAAARFGWRASVGMAEVAQRLCRAAVA